MHSAPRSGIWARFAVSGDGAIFLFLFFRSWRSWSQRWSIAPLTSGSRGDGDLGRCAVRRRQRRSNLERRLESLMLDDLLSRISDLNRFVVKTSKSRDILYDKRDKGAPSS